MLEFWRLAMPSSSKIDKPRAPRNRTITLAKNDEESLRKQLIYADSVASLEQIRNRILCGDAFEVLKKLPEGSFDLLFADPPYNLTKDFGAEKFRQRSLERYEAWLDSWVRLCKPLLRETASIYICGDW